MAKLTEKQEKFAQLVGAEGINQSEAYRRAYSAENMSDRAVWVEASKLSTRPDISLRIAELRKIRDDAAVNAITFNVKKLMDTYVAIAMTDPNELISQRVGCCRHCWGEGFGYQWKEREYLEAVAAWERAEKVRKPGVPETPMPDPAGGFGYMRTRLPNPECVECEGEGIWRIVPMDTTQLSEGARHLYRGVQQTRDGVKVLFADKDKALDNIGRMLGAFDDRLRVEADARVASLKLTTSDPKEAADAYQTMITGKT